MGSWLDGAPDEVRESWPIYADTGEPVNVGGQVEDAKGRVGHVCSIRIGETVDATVKLRGADGRVFDVRGRSLKRPDSMDRVCTDAGRIVESDSNGHGVYDAYTEYIDARGIDPGDMTVSVVVLKDIVDRARRLLDARGDA